jgi:hypothetical protein
MFPLSKICFVVGFVLTLAIVNFIVSTDNRALSFSNTKNCLHSPEPISKKIVESEKFQSWVRTIQGYY